MKYCPNAKQLNELITDESKFLDSLAGLIFALSDVAEHGSIVTADELNRLADLAYSRADEVRAVPIVYDCTDAVL